MTKIHIPFVSFLILLFLTFSYTFDISTSVVPGWHTTIFPPYFIGGVTLALLVLLLFATIGYWVLIKLVGKINWTLFIIHLMMTIPSVFFLKFPLAFLNTENSNEEEILVAFSLYIKLLSIALILFIIGQILFFIYLIIKLKNIKNKGYS